MRYLLAVLLTLTTPPALAWDHQGHEVTGAIADQFLTPAAKKNLKEIAGISLRSASKWADCVKGVEAKDGAFKYAPNIRYEAACKEFETPAGIKELEEYAARNWDSCDKSSNTSPCHSQYHYTDVAIQHDKYDRAYAGTNDHDVVGAINAAIAVLQGKPAPAPFSIKNQREAVLLLAHFVGDIHQPLHVGAVYLDSLGDLVNPDLPGQQFDPKTVTRGGNSITVGSSNLHALWDTIPASIKPDRISATMLQGAKGVGITPGSITAWPTTWATETLGFAKSAFKDITFNQDPKKPGHWLAEFKERKAYLKAKNGIQREQLAKAGARLAMVLNEVWK